MKNTPVFRDGEDSFFEGERQLKMLVFSVVLSTVVNGRDEGILGWKWGGNVKRVKEVKVVKIVKEVKVVKVGKRVKVVKKVKVVIGVLPF